MSRSQGPGESGPVVWRIPEPRRRGMKRLLFGSVLGGVGTLALLGWPGRSVSEQPRWVTSESQGEHCQTPILPPLGDGEHHDCAKPPDGETILRALPRVVRSIPYVCEVSRDDINFTVECLVDQVD